MFEVDRKGLAQLIEHDRPSRLVYELIQNAWDEKVKRVDVTLEPVDGCRRIRVIVTDDSPEGWKNLTDAYTLFAPSYKKGIAHKRGRFNFGEKLVLAVAKRAEIVTTSGTITFEDGKRTTSRKKSQRGSAITVEMPWVLAQMHEVIDDLHKLIGPPTVTTTINGDDLEFRDPIKDNNFVTLLTVLDDGSGALRDTQRRAELCTYEVKNGEVGTLYEMGIPVVETGDPWHVDIGQKVPLTLDRQNVRPAFLKKVRGHVLNIMQSELTPETANEKWADEALESGVASDVAVSSMMTERFGEKRVAYDPSDHEANKIAMGQGYTIVHGGSLSKGAWSAVKDAGTTLPAGKVTPSPKVMTSPDGEPPIPRDDWTPAMRAFDHYARTLAHLSLAASISVGFYRLGLSVAAQAAYSPGGLIVNYSRAKALVEGCNKREWDALLFHEFAHHTEDDHFSHKFLNAALDLAADHIDRYREALGRDIIAEYV